MYINKITDYYIVKHFKGSFAPTLYVQNVGDDKIMETPNIHVKCFHYFVYHLLM